MFRVLLRESVLIEASWNMSSLSIINNFIVFLVFLVTLIVIIEFQLNFSYQFCFGWDLIDKLIFILWGITVHLVKRYETQLLLINVHRYFQTSLLIEFNPFWSYLELIPVLKCIAIIRRRRYIWNDDFFFKISRDSMW